MSSRHSYVALGVVITTTPDAPNKAKPIPGVENELGLGSANDDTVLSFCCTPLSALSGASMREGERVSAD